MPPSLLAECGLGLAGSAKVCRTEEVFGSWTGFCRSAEQRIIPSDKKVSDTRTTSCSESAHVLCVRALCTHVDWNKVIKGRSLSMRLFSRTHRIALDWLFDRINLDPKIQINYIDIKNQLADILTKGNFTRDEWIIFCVCSALAISVLQMFRKRCRKEQKKMQVKKESQQNQSR